MFSTMSRRLLPRGRPTSISKWRPPGVVAISIVPDAVEAEGCSHFFFVVWKLFSSSTRLKTEPLVKFRRVSGGASFASMTSRSGRRRRAGSGDSRPGRPRQRPGVAIGHRSSSLGRRPTVTPGTKLTRPSRHTRRDFGSRGLAKCGVEKNHEQY